MGPASVDHGGPTSVNLSKAARLKDMIFRIDSSGPAWVTAALRTITPEHRDLRRILIFEAHLSTFVGFGATVPVVGEQTLGEWLELDRVLAQLWEAYSTPPKIMCRAPLWREIPARDLMGRLLPEATLGGTVNLSCAW